MLPWRWREVRITYSLKERAETRDRLAAAGIENLIRTKNIAAPTFSDRRGDFGTLGMKMDASCEYKIFVRKDDYERAQHEIYK